MPEYSISDIKADQSQEAVNARFGDQTLIVTGVYRAQMAGAGRPRQLIPVGTKIQNITATHRTKIASARNPVQERVLTGWINGIGQISFTECEIRFYTEVEGEVTKVILDLQLKQQFVIFEEIPVFETADGNGFTVIPIGATIQIVVDTDNVVQGEQIWEVLVTPEGAQNSSTVFIVPSMLKIEENALPIEELLEEP
jgi:hypothetical protein